jgi:hypothetical protein
VEVKTERRRVTRWVRRALREPVALAGAIMGAVNVAAVFHIVSLSDQQIGVLNIGLAAVLGLFARTLVTPVVQPRSRHGHPLVPAAEPAAERAPAH